MINNRKRVFQRFSKQLDSSIYVVSTTDNTMTVGYTKPHLIYQDLGVSGTDRTFYESPFKFTDKQPPTEPIREWVSDKNIASSQDSAGIAYVIARSIKIQGITPKNYFKNEDESIEKLHLDVVESDMQYIEQIIDKALR